MIVVTTAEEDGGRDRQWPGTASKRRSSNAARKDEAFRREFIADPVGVFVKYFEVSEESMPKVSVHQEERVSGASYWRSSCPMSVIFQKRASRSCRRHSWTSRCA